MDTRLYPPLVLQKTLSFLQLTNRWFGGAQTVLRHFQYWSKRWDKTKPVHVLDVGAGLADIPVALARWARGEGFSLKVTALEQSPVIAGLARQHVKDFPEIVVEEKNIFDLNQSPERYDYVTASLFLHHTPQGLEAPTLRLFDRLAQKGVVVSDLERSPAGFWAVTVLSRLAGNFVVRNDGPLSVRRAFRLEELSALAKEAGAAYLTPRREPWFRLSLAGEKH